MLISDYLSTLLILKFPKTFIPLLLYIVYLSTRKWLERCILTMQIESQVVSVNVVYRWDATCTHTHVHLIGLTQTHVWHTVHTFDPDKRKSMRFLSQVHSRRAAPPTVLNLMELEYAKMRESISELEAIFRNFRQFCRSIRKSAH